MEILGQHPSMSGSVIGPVIGPVIARSVVATFDAQRQALAGTAWQVTGLNNGKHAVVSAQIDSTVTMVFSADGRVGSSAGCNRYIAGYAADGSRLTCWYR